MIWQILIPTVESRTDKLCRLLEVLWPQLGDGVEVLVFRDNMEHGVGYKRNHLIASADADYVSQMDDDDLVVPDFVSTIRPLMDGVDVVSFDLNVNGEPNYRDFLVRHSIRLAPVWHSQGRDRDLGHICPIRRELAAQAKFGEGWGDDDVWVDHLRRLNIVSTEHRIDRRLYEYEVSAGELWNGAEPAPVTTPNPAYPNVRYIEWS